MLERRHETPAPLLRRPSRQPCRSSHSGRHVRQASPPGACTLTWLLPTRSGRQRHEAARLRRCTAARGRPRLRDPSLQQCRLQAADSLARRACRRQPSPCRRSSQCAARLTEVPPGGTQRAFDIGQRGGLCGIIPSRITYQACCSTSFSSSRRRDSGQDEAEVAELRKKEGMADCGGHSAHPAAVAKALHDLLDAAYSSGALIGLYRSTESV